MIKTRLLRLAGKGLAGARAHLRYIQRDGAARGHAPGALYSRDSEDSDGRAFLERSEGDRHQFRFIVSAENGAQYDDLKPLIRRWMGQMEEDLGTTLDWIAVDHHDTGHPHTHVMLRGVDDRRANLVIAREYISSGMRERLAELVTLDLGPRSDLEAAQTQRHEISAERLTEIDRTLVREARRDGVLEVRHPDPFRHALRVARMRKLAGLGLAERLGGSRWRLVGDLEDRLRDLGERGDIVRTMQHALGERAALAELVIDRMSPLAAPLVGRVVERGLSDELRDRHYLVVEAIDGRAHYVDLGRGDAVSPIAPGSIVHLSAKVPTVRESDRTIAAVAAANGGIYSGAFHRADDPSAGAAFVDAHVRRLEAVRRVTGGVERAADGSWHIEQDYLAAAETYEAARAATSPVTIEVLSPVRLEQLVEAQAATWLDRELLAERPQSLRDAGFGREVRHALAARRQWLLVNGLASEMNGSTTYAGDMLARLQRQDVLRAARALATELGLDFRGGEGHTVAGRLTRRVDLASGRFALVTRARDFSLVPWRDGMERHIGRELSIGVRGGQATWRIARGRDGPEIG